MNKIIQSKAFNNFFYTVLLLSVSGLLGTEWSVTQPEIESFGNDLKELRKESELSIKSASRKLVISKTQLKRIELNKEFPSEGLIERIKVLFKAETYNKNRETRLRKKIPQAIITPRPKTDVLQINRFE